MVAAANVGLDDPPTADEFAVRRRSCRRGYELWQPRQVVGGGREGEGPSDAIAPPNWVFS